MNRLGLALSACVVVCAHGHRTQLDAGVGILLCEGESVVVPEGSILGVPNPLVLSLLQGRCLS